MCGRPAHGRAREPCALGGLLPREQPVLGEICLFSVGPGTFVRTLLAVALSFVDVSRLPTRSFQNSEHRPVLISGVLRASDLLPCNGVLPLRTRSGDSCKAR